MRDNWFCHWRTNNGDDIKAIWTVKMFKFDVMIDGKTQVSLFLVTDSHFWFYNIIVSSSLNLHENETIIMPCYNVDITVT